MGTISDLYDQIQKKFIIQRSDTATSDYSNFRQTFLLLKFTFKGFLSGKLLQKTPLIARFSFKLYNCSARCKLQNLTVDFPSMPLPSNTTNLLNQSIFCIFYFLYLFTALH